MKSFIYILFNRNKMKSILLQIVYEDTHIKKSYTDQMDDDGTLLGKQSKLCWRK